MGGVKPVKDYRARFIFVNDRARITIFPLLALILLMIVMGFNRHLLTRSSGSVIYTYVASFAEGEIGTGYGAPIQGSVPFDRLEPGDIVLGGWPNTAYGRYSHAGLYLGGDEVLEGYVDYGLSVQDVRTYEDYSLICLLRVNAPADVKARAVRLALEQEKKMFYPLAFKSGDRLWNCSKIIWRAYDAQGINLDEIGDLWIAPESLANSRRVTILYEKGI